MLKTIAPAEMAQLEKCFMAETHVPGALLMDYAARGVCDALRRHVPQTARVLFLCGPGNNGGDGYAAARLWQSAGGKSEVLELKSDPTGDAGMNRTLCMLQRIPVYTAETWTGTSDCAAMVDALFGTGLSRAIDGIAADLIDMVNRSGLPVVAVDIPSGLSGLTGEVLGCAVKAEETVTFHRPKPGLYLRQGPDHTGRVTVQPILIPKDYGHTEGLRVMEAGDLTGILPRRSPVSHKGTYGRAVIFAGSMGMCGAAAFAAKACIKTGAGLTTLLCRESIAPILQTLVPEVTCTILPEKDGKLTDEAVSIAASAFAGADAVAAGCGLGQQADVLPVLACIQSLQCPAVWDADALNLLAKHPTKLMPHHVLTPHPGEAARMLGISAAAVTADPISAMEKLHQQYGGTVLLKGARSLMTDDTHHAINGCGTPALAKGGSGDILTGILCALLAMYRDIDSLTLTQAASLIHARAAISAAEKRGEHNVLPGDIIEEIRI
ncbi:MAG: NAD(P)H-hydrate dehydratase [Clostridia bacterium]|nr:NAD(P)H-hydrate dehydratase [Clostridia bacterium]